MYNNNPRNEVIFRAELNAGYLLYFGYLSKDEKHKLVIIDYMDADEHFKELIFEDSAELYNYILQNVEIQNEIDSIYKWDEKVLGEVPDRFKDFMDEDEYDDLDEYPNEVELDGELEIE